MRSGIFKLPIKETVMRISLFQLHIVTLVINMM